MKASLWEWSTLLPLTAPRPETENGSSICPLWTFVELIGFLHLKNRQLLFFKWKLPIFYQDEKQTEIHCSNMMNTFLYLENWKTMECVLCSHVRAGPSRRQKLGDMLDVVAPTTCNKLTVRKTGKHQHQCSWQPVRSHWGNGLDFTHSLLVGCLVRRWVSYKTSFHVSSVTLH